MSDKQRQQHLATYWNGPVSRIEAQKVFDETAGVIKAQGEVITKLDMVLAFLVEKSGHTTAEIQAWMNDRMRAMQEAAPPAPTEQPFDGLLHDPINVKNDPVCLVTAD